MRFQTMRSGVLAIIILCAACSGGNERDGGSANATSSPAVPTNVRATGTVAGISPSLAAPTATEVPAPAPRTFTENFDGNLPHWKTIQVDTGGPAVIPNTFGGYLRFDLRQPYAWVYEIYDGQQYDDVRVDAHVEIGEDGQGAPGVICRYDPAKGWYELDLQADQTYVLLFGQWLAEGVARYTPLSRARSEKIKPAENEIGLECKGDTLTPFINGIQMRRRPETTIGLTGGQVGLAASSFEAAPFFTQFDWVKVSLP